MKKKIIVEEEFADFKPHEYLNEYYTSDSKVSEENYKLLEFFVRAYADVSKNALMLEFGGGPTIYQLISAAGRVREIHFSDYVKSNLQEVKKWQRNEKDAFSWKSFFGDTLKLEGMKKVGSKDIADREKILRQKLSRFLHCDAFLPDPLGPSSREKYDVVAVNFVPEGITSSKKIWKQLIRNIASLLKPGGVLINTAVREADFWKVGDKKYVACSVTENDMFDMLKKLKFRRPKVELDVFEAENLEVDADTYEGYKGVFCLKAIK